jgi:hypothetical protein
MLLWLRSKRNNKKWQMRKLNSAPNQIELVLSGSSCWGMSRACPRHSKKGWKFLKAKLLPKKDWVNRLLLNRSPTKPAVGRGDAQRRSKIPRSIPPTTPGRYPMLAAGVCANGTGNFTPSSRLLVRLPRLFGITPQLSDVGQAQRKSHIMDEPSSNR